jgi:hypothetical protein
MRGGSRIEQLILPSRVDDDATLTATESPPVGGSQPSSSPPVGQRGAGFRAQAASATGGIISFVNFGRRTNKERDSSNGRLSETRESNSTLGTAGGRTSAPATRSDRRLLREGGVGYAYDSMSGAHVSAGDARPVSIDSRAAGTWLNRHGQQAAAGSRVRRSYGEEDDNGGGPMDPDEFEEEGLNGELLSSARNSSPARRDRLSASRSMGSRQSEGVPLWRETHADEWPPPQTHPSAFPISPTRGAKALKGFFRATLGGGGATALAAPDGGGGGGGGGGNGASPESGPGSRLLGGNSGRRSRDARAEALRKSLRGSRAQSCSAGGVESLRAQAEGSSFTRRHRPQRLTPDSKGSAAGGGPVRQFFKPTSREAPDAASLSPGGLSTTPAAAVSPIARDRAAAADAAADGATAAAGAASGDDGGGGDDDDDGGRLALISPRTLAARKGGRHEPDAASVALEQVRARRWRLRMRLLSAVAAGLAGCVGASAGGGWHPRARLSVARSLTGVATAPFCPPLAVRARLCRAGRGGDGQRALQLPGLRADRGRRAPAGWPRRRGGRHAAVGQVRHAAEPRRRAPLSRPLRRLGPGRVRGLAWRRVPLLACRSVRRALPRSPFPPSL